MSLTKIKLHPQQAPEAQKPMTYRFSCRLSALAGAAALLCSLAASPAYALGLGRITVQSALGEALRAEVEVPQITADEAASLKVGVASADAFKAAGLEYTSAVLGVQVSLQKRADGRSFLRLSSSRPITEPFVDLILEANWASGRVVRDYTLLFDPPNLRQAATPVAPTAPVLPRPSAPPTAGTASPPYYPPSPPPAQAAVRPAPVARMQPKPAATRPAPAANAPTPNGQKVAVKPGDTASKIAAQTKPASISLDQMLVALLRSNPDAFIAGNINRLKSGAVLDIPAAEEAGALPAGEASRTIIAQAKDFNDFRQKLASGIPAAKIDSATRQAGGKVQAKVEDRTTAAATPDKLTLSKGAVQGNAAAEDKIVKDKQAKDASSRVAELTKNLGDLNKVAGTVPGATSTASSATGAKPPVAPVIPGVQIPAIASPAISTPTIPSIAPAAPSSANPGMAGVTTAPTITSSIATVATTSVAATTATTGVQPVAVANAPLTASPTASSPVAIKKPAVAAPPQLPQPSLIDELTSNPLVLPGLGLLLALLAAFGFYRYKRRNDQPSVDSSFLESRLQPDSFFGASGGQRIDTSEAGSASGSSLVYSPSQLDAAGDVDPVAEADVYLAYGRDLQAEEILKEALRTNPSRVAIHAKLMEIYAKRRDLKGFESVAADALTLTRGNGPEWAYICELGRDLDPTNPMYQSSDSSQVAPSQAADLASSFGAAATVPQMLVSPPQAAASSVDFDLDLDFSAPNKPLQAKAVEPIVMPDFEIADEPTLALPARNEPVFGGLDMDFGNEPVSAVNLPAVQKPLDNSLSFDLDPLPLPIANKVVPTPVAAAATAQDNGMLEFDMSTLSLDLNPPITQSPTLTRTTTVAIPVVTEGPLETKFALAEEFRALGDSDGARSLANEVVAQADGALKLKAQAFLSGLS